MQEIWPPQECAHERGEEIAGQTSSESFRKALYYALFGLACLAILGAISVFHSWAGTRHFFANDHIMTWLMVVNFFLFCGAGIGFLGALYISAVGLLQRRSERSKST